MQVLPPVAPPSKKRSSRAGFSLVEVLIGSVVLILVIFPAIAVMAQANKTLDSARMATLASSVLQTQAEDLRAMSYANLKSAYFPSAKASDTNPVTVTIKQRLIDDEKFKGAFFDKLSVNCSFKVLQDATGSITKELAEAQIVVSWTDAFGKTCNHTYYSRFSDGGLNDAVYNGFSK